MIELAENLFEIAAISFCLALTLYRVSRSRQRSWILLSFFYASSLLAALYWTLYLLFYHRTPPIFYVSELGWCASYLFLILLLRHYQTDQERSVRSPLLWCIAAFVCGMMFFYFRWGDYLLNVADAVLMGLLMIRSVQGLLSLNASPDRRRGLYTTVLILCLNEYAMWTASCFWTGDTIRNSYFWFSALLIVIQFFFFPAVRKAEEK